MIGKDTASLTVKAGIVNKSGATAGNIEIKNCKEINATGVNSAGIGSVSNTSMSEAVGNITIKNCTEVTATGSGSPPASGIGSGYGGKAGDIEITGCGTIKATGNYGAGIGGGYNGSVGNITIKNCQTITATGTSGAGIGGGGLGDTGNITITDSQITAQGYLSIPSTYSGAGIGGGSIANGSKKLSTGIITISGGSITAAGSVGSAGIGGGNNWSSGKITIENGAEVTATGNSGGAGIGGGNFGDNDNITISGCNTVNAAGGNGGAGIGGGYNGKSTYILIENCIKVIVKGSSYSGASGGGAGIGGGYNRDSEQIIIKNTEVEVSDTGEGGAGIGGGSSGSGGTINIEDTTGSKTITATSYYSKLAPGAAIGGGSGNGFTEITISGYKVNASVKCKGTSTTGGAAIGIGRNASTGGQISINECDLTAVSPYGYGIGGTNNGSVNISGGKTVAIGCGSGIYNAIKGSSLNFSDNAVICAGISDGSSTSALSTKPTIDNKYIHITFADDTKNVTVTDIEDGLETADNFWECTGFSQTSWGKSRIKIEPMENAKLEVTAVPEKIDLNGTEPYSSELKVIFTANYGETSCDKPLEVDLLKNANTQSKTSIELNGSDYASGTKIDGSTLTVDKNEPAKEVEVIGYFGDSNYYSNIATIALIRPHTVTFSITNDTTSVDDQTVEDGQPAKDPSITDPDRTLDGWYIYDSCTGDKWDFSDPVTKNMTLYAKWICTVTFDSNCEDVDDPDPQTVDYNSPVSDPFSTPL